MPATQCDALFAALGGKRSGGDAQWTSFRLAPIDGIDVWLGFIEDPSVVPNANRIAFGVTSREEVDRVAAALPSAGAQTIEGPDESEGYYAVFFEDPDGHKYEVCCTPV